MKVAANEYVQDAQHWDANRYDVKSGDTVTLRDKFDRNTSRTRCRW